MNGMGHHYNLDRKLEHRYVKDVGGGLETEVQLVMAYIE